MKTIIAIVLGLVIIFGGFRLLDKFSGPPTRCPKCNKRNMVWIDSDVFYDPAPRQTLHRCISCGAEMIYNEKTWIARSDWPVESDRKFFDS